MSRADDAVALYKLGWNIVAAAPRSKNPLGAWKRWQTERIPLRLVRESFSGDQNLFVITGGTSRLAVLDCDDQRGYEYWCERLGEDTLKATTRARVKGSDRPGHFYFRLAPGQIERGRSSPGGDAGKWDLRAEGGGVIAPPSIHPSGEPYEWIEGHGPETLQDAPAGLFERVEGEEETEGPRSLLSHLLSSPPQGEGQRNVWLTQVAGHYALHLPHRDAYETLVREAAAKIDPPLPEAEIVKTIESIWQTEQAKVGKAVEPISEEDQWRSELVEPAIETGWLVSGNNRLLVQIRKRVEGQWELGLAMWMDADIRALGVVESEDDRTYEVELRKASGERIIAALPASVVGSNQRLPVWLAGYGVSIGVPDEIWPSRMRDGARLLRYLEAQKAPALEAVPYLGWHDESRAFITHDHIIRSDGPSEFEAVRPSPTMKDWAKYRYGHEAGKEQARDILRRVLEFHDETVASVFGSWWAAALVKPHIQQQVSQFPFMALEAASESGKTTGYFNLMMQLSGHFGGQSNPTPAALRDALSANRNGIVWVDDLDNLDHHGELLRNVTVGGSLVKKGEDNHRQIVAQMRAALVISGEGLGLHGQKALLDRSLLLSVPSPVGRVNRKGRPQWDDIVELYQQFPDLTDLAGSIVELALGQIEEGILSELKELRPGSGRFADKIAIVRIGARILAGMTQQNWMVEYADGWALSQENPGAENALTLTVIPEVLATTGRKTRPEGPDEARRLVPTPVFVDEEGIVWFSPMLLAQWLQRNRRRGGSLRLETRQALEDQARALGLGGGKNVDRKQFRFTTSDGRAVYWRCDPTLSAELIARSEGLEQRQQTEQKWQTEEENGQDQNSELF